MPYEKQIFVNRIIDEDGNIIQAGTNLRAEHFNKMEDAIAVAIEGVEQMPINGGGEETYRVLEESDIDSTLSVEGKVADAKVVGDRFTALTEENDHVKETFESFSGVGFVDFSYVAGEFVNNKGYIARSVIYSRSVPIAVESGDKISFTACGLESGIISMISLCDATGSSVVAKVLSDSDAPKTYEYLCVNDGYVLLSYNNEAHNPHNLTINRNTQVNPHDLGATFIKTGWNTDKYINMRGEILNYAGMMYSAPVSVSRGDRIIINGNGIINVVSMIATCEADGSDIVPVVLSRSSEKETYIYDCKKDGYIVLCCKLCEDEQVYADQQFFKIASYTPAYENYFDLSLFTKVGVIGDSYASGCIYKDGTTGMNLLRISWLQILARKHGFTGTNYSWGGLSTRTWLTNSRGLNKLNASEAEELYVLALGINDTALGVEYIGSESDIKTDYTQNADTFWGNYGKIISSIQAHAPNAKLIISTVATEHDNAQQFNEAIKGIANHFNIPIITQMEDEFFNSEYYKSETKVTYHPNALGYSGMACAFERLINDCIVKNSQYFKDLFVGEIN